MVSVIVASHNAREYIERCVGALSETRHEVIVIDSASSDGTADFVRERFPDVRLVPLTENRGYGAALNEGTRLSGARYFLLMNGDAWPKPGAIEELLDFAESEQRAGVIGPRLLNLDGTLQPSVRGFPTLWRLATEYLFLRWLAPRSRALNAFYSAGFNHQSVRDAEFLVGAVLLVRREVVDEIGVFDTRFFMFNEEVDFCYRVREAGWRVVFYPGAQFVHVGGASTRLDWSRMYREQLDHICGSWPSTADIARPNMHDVCSSWQCGYGRSSSGETEDAFPERLRGGSLGPMFRPCWTLPGRGSPADSRGLRAGSCTSIAISG